MLCKRHFKLIKYIQITDSDNINVMSVFSLYAEFSSNCSGL